MPPIIPRFGGRKPPVALATLAMLIGRQNATKGELVEFGFQANSKTGAVDCGIRVASHTRAVVPAIGIPLSKETTSVSYT